MFGSALPVLISKPFLREFQQFANTVAFLFIKKDNYKVLCFCFQLFSIKQFYVTLYNICGQSILIQGKCHCVGVVLRVVYQIFILLVYHLVRGIREQVYYDFFTSVSKLRY